MNVGEGDGDVCYAEWEFWIEYCIVDFDFDFDFDFDLGEIVFLFGPYLTPFRSNTSLAIYSIHARKHVY